MTGQNSKPPSLAEIAALAAEAFAALPEPFRARCEGLAFQVDELPDAALCAELGLESPFDLLGLYHGRDLAHRSVFDVAQDVDRIVLYRMPILRYWRAHDDSLADIVSHVLVHEIGHHFGFSDEDMDGIEAADEA
jgi:predicted Zn-dependent protease with MMP-like domain